MAETKSIGFYLKETLALKGIMKAPDEHNCHGFGVEIVYTQLVCFFLLIWNTYLSLQ